MTTFGQMFTAVDSHTAGEPTRIVLSGFPPIPGKTMLDRWTYAREHFQHLRSALLHEPRGHSGMYGAILTPPASPGADWGLLFMTSNRFSTMCGHGTIGTATVLVEMGLVPKQEPETTIHFDTPAGLVTVRVEVKGGRAQYAWLENVPAFLLAEGVKVEVPGLGVVRVDISFGGNFFALVSAEEVGVRVEPGETPRLVELGLRIRQAVNEQFRAVHPLDERINTVADVVFMAPPTRAGATAKNVVIFGEGSFDRSPCGTGTSARIATLYAKGKLAIGEPFVHESIIGTLFTAKVLRETEVGPLRAVIPCVGSTAYITGINQWVIDPADPLREGFLVI